MIKIIAYKKEENMKWWKKHKFRMIQNNLRDIDGQMDVDYEIAMLKKFHANVVQLGCGGISAFSETSLDCQKPSPYLQGDKFRELLDRCHQNQIRVIARFDVSKVHESFLETHPEWLQRTAAGDAVFYNDTVLTCVNGPYQQEKTIEIIGEILRKYPVDGIFFNAFGYSTYDYSGNYIGICQCESCKRRFREMYGIELPVNEDPVGPAYQQYQEFKQRTVDMLLQKITDSVKKINPDVAVSTYFDQGIDIIRSESNTAVNRPLPMWIYSASENVASIEGTFADKVSSNCAINAVDLPYRFMGVSDTFNRIKLYETIANGGNLDWCIIGAFEDYPDRSNFRGVEEVFSFHERYQAVFDQIHSMARVLLIQPSPPYTFRFSPEYRGIFKMLKESHIPFDSIIDLDVETYARDIKEYDLIIVPGIKKLKSQKLREAMLASKAAFITTAGSFSEDEELLEAIQGIRKLIPQEEQLGAYFLTEPKTVFSSFADQDWVYQNGSFWTAEEGKLPVKKVLPYLSPAMFGPPERCFGHKVTELAGAVVFGNRICIPWEIGKLYYQQGFEAFKHIFLDLEDTVVSRSSLLPFETDAHSSLEMIYSRVGNDRALLQMINLSGFNGVTIGEPIRQKDIRIRFKDRPGRIERLTPEGTEEISTKDGQLAVKECGLYEAFLIYDLSDK